MTERVAQVRGVLAERVVVSSELDPFLSLKALTSYSNLSVRTLRAFLTDPRHPLPCYRVGANPGPAQRVRRLDAATPACRLGGCGPTDG